MSNVLISVTFNGCRGSIIPTRAALDYYTRLGGDEIIVQKYAVMAPPSNLQYWIKGTEAALITIINSLRSLVGSKGPIEADNGKIDSGLLADFSFSLKQMGNGDWLLVVDATVIANGPLTSTYKANSTPPPAP
jgi:hypothetical protein